MFARWHGAGLVRYATTVGVNRLQDRRERRSFALEPSRRSKAQVRSVSARRRRWQGTDPAMRWLLYDHYRGCCERVVM